MLSFFTPYVWWKIKNTTKKNNFLEVIISHGATLIQANFAPHFD